MKLSEYRGEDALEIVANMIEPAAEIFGDKEFAKLWQSGDKAGRVQAAKHAIKAHKEAVIVFLAASDGVNVDDREAVENYTKRLTVFTIPVKLLQILNDKDIIGLFSSQEQTTVQPSSGPAMEDMRAADGE